MGRMMKDIKYILLVFLCVLLIQACGKTDSESISNLENKPRERTIHIDKITIEADPNGVIPGAVEALYDDHIEITESGVRTNGVIYKVYKSEAGRETGEYGWGQTEKVYWVPQIEGMEDQEKQERLNRILKQESEEWLLVNWSFAETKLYIEYQSDKYLSYSYQMVYPSENGSEEYIDIYITIDLENESRVRLSDLVYMEDETFAKQVAKYCYGDETREDSWRERLNDANMTLKELKKYIEEKRGESEKIWETSSFFEYLLNHSSFYLRPGRIMIQYDPYPYSDITIEIAAFEEYLKVEPWY